MREREEERRRRRRRRWWRQCGSDRPPVSTPEATNSIGASFVRASEEKERESKSQSETRGSFRRYDDVSRTTVEKLPASLHRRPTRFSCALSTSSCPAAKCQLGLPPRRAATLLIGERRRRRRGTWCYVVVDREPRDSSVPVTKSARSRRREDG